MKRQNYRSSNTSPTQKHPRNRYNRYSAGLEIEMAKENCQMHSKIQMLEEANHSLNESLQRLQQENLQLKQRVSELEAHHSRLGDTHNKLKQQMAHFLHSNHELFLKNRSEQMSSFKEQLSLFLNFFKEGPLPNQQSAQILAQAQRVTSEFISYIESASFVEKMQAVRVVHKTHKNEIISELRKQCEQILKKNNDQQKELLQKQRQMIGDFPEQLKIVKEASKSREEVYRKHLLLLERQIKEMKQTYQTKQKKYQEEINRLKLNYNNLLTVHKKEVEIPLANIKKNIDSQIELIKVKFQQANQSKNFKDVTSQLVDVINRYLEYKEEGAEDNLQSCRMITMDQLKSIGEWWQQTLKRIDQTLNKKNDKIKDVQQFLEARMREEEEKNKEEKKQYNFREMETKINYQRQYIVMLEKYQNKLQSCIKRISADRTIETEWKREKQEYDQQRQKFQEHCLQVKESNNKVVIYLADIQTIQTTNKKQIAQLNQLFKQCLAQQQKLVSFNHELSKFMEHDSLSKKYIYEQTNKFSQIFMEHYSKLCTIKDELPTLQTLPPLENSQTEESEQKKHRKCEQHRDSCIELMKEHEELAKCKRVIEARLTKSINDILGAHEEYLKVARSKQSNISLNIDDKLLNSMSNKIYMKLEEAFGCIRNFKEELARIEQLNKHSFEIASAEMKKLVHYLRGNKFEQSLSDLRSVIEGEHRYMSTLEEMVSRSRRQGQSEL